MKNKIKAGMSVLGAFALVISVPFAANASGDSSPENHQVMLHEIEKLNSKGVPLNLEANPDTGEIVSYEINESGIAPAATWQWSCVSGVRACWEAPIPAAQVGFYGTGSVVNGSWGGRTLWRQHVGSGFPCWHVPVTGTVCSQATIYAGGTLNWGGSSVTGTQAHLY